MGINGLFKALSDENRRKILDLLKEGDLTAGEIADHFEMSKAGISQHLSVLKNADLVYAVKRGQYVYYSLNATVFQEVLKWVVQFQSPSKGENER
ncbi:transcriptional regulator [Sutcliffiella horikoshii]|uniref:Transcriptional regulator n=1 Tax=Sutcliffiella horikoshii TaxID=79883 RepID=A0A1Y0CJR9_9BACI|nr:transcriptional regulator [Sutcliffiella horikoshii]TYS58564.1 winged helix-turn-helix transcriptional regulator [Sutcliffiella horikoshii]TYS71781.1 winged helix-turn-helix transcriptional regulator [Sutcliffiella horikoshii]